MVPKKCNTIVNLYTKTENIRIGGEVRFQPFSIRAGYALYGSPYKDKIEYTTQNYSFGIGMNYGSYYLDASYLYRKKYDEYLLYDETLINPIQVINENHSLVITLGFRY